MSNTFTDYISFNRMNKNKKASVIPIFDDLSSDDKNYVSKLVSLGMETSEALKLLAKVMQVEREEVRIKDSKYSKEELRNMRLTRDDGFQYAAKPYYTANKNSSATIYQNNANPRD